MYKDLSLKEKSELFKLMVSNGITDINEIERIYNSYQDGGYLSYMEKLAKKKAKDWGMGEDETLTMMLNNNEYDYRAFYDNHRDVALKMLTADPEAHFTDIGKTVWHPTFSNESIYSGKVSEYNPKGTIGGSWLENQYIPSDSQITNGDFNYRKTADYLYKSPGREFIDDGYNPDYLGKRPNYLELNTFYPFTSRYPYTGHSALLGTEFSVDENGKANYIHRVSKNMNDKGYNIVTNNCSDATKCALENVFNKELDTFLFTTPGDVQDWAVEELGGISKIKEDSVFNPKKGKYVLDTRSYKTKERKSGKSTVYIPVTPEQRRRYIDYVKKGKEEGIFKYGGKVNKYWDGGSVETPQQKLFNKSTIDDRPTTTNSELQWFNNWYTNRTHLINIKDAQNHINQIYKTPEKNINIIDPYTIAFYDPNNKIIYYDKNVKPEDKIHERTHAGEFKRQERLIKNFAILPKYILEQNDYLDSPNEVYARLNEVRFKNKLNPLQIYTLNDIKYLKQHGYDNEILNRYDDDTLLFLFNEIAQNNNDKSNTNIEPNLTAFGGKINKFDEGGNVVLPNVVVSPRNSYYTYTGKETVTPTWQEFAKAKQNEARDDAYLGMLSQGKPIVPEIPNQNTFAKLINVGMTTFGANDQDVIKVVGKEGPENVFTCINTVTGQYDDCNQVSGNITFSKSPSKYGFKEVNTPRIGDLVQFTDNTGTPHHAAMVTGFDENGEPIISYSDGGWESESMKYDKDTWKKDFEGDTWKYYTFIGNRKNASKWREEYDKKFKNKVK